MVIGFAVEEARNQLLEHGEVYTFRWKRRKQVGNNWANSGRGTKKIADVHIMEVKKVMPNFQTLKNYWDKSGFSNWWDWYNKIMEMKPKNKLQGWLYYVKIKENGDLL